MDGAASTLVFLAGITAIIVLTSRFKLPPFLVILFAALGVGLASGLPPESLGGVVSGGFGSSLGYTAVITVCAIVMGEIMKATGAIVVISRAVVGALGRERGPLAVGVLGYIVAYPVLCCDTSFIMLTPLIESLASNGNLMVYILSLGAGAFANYAMLFPAAPLLPVSLMQVDVAQVLILGFLVSLPALAVGLFLANRIGRGMKANITITEGRNLDDLAAQYSRLPGFASVVFVVLAPIALIVARAVAHGVGASPPLLEFLGSPVVAMPVGVVLSAALLARGYRVEEVNEWISGGVSKSAGVLMIIGSGSVLASVLQKTGVGAYLGGFAAALPAGGLLAIFLISAILKGANGGTTVTMTTAVAIVGPLLPALGVSPVLAVLTICAGAMTLMHVNDSFFWVVTGFSKMSVAEGYRTLTVINLAMGVTAFAAITVLGSILLRV